MGTNKLISIIRNWLQWIKGNIRPKNMQNIVVLSRAYLDHYKSMTLSLGWRDVIVSLLLVIAVTTFAGNHQAMAYELTFSTYLGGTRSEDIRDIIADSQGNTFVAGDTVSPDFPTTAGVYDRTFNGGTSDAFVAKFDPKGNLIWSTYLGGPGHDRAYAIELDRFGFVYIAGRAGPSFPVTSNAFQTTFQGSHGGRYGMQNAFIAKLSPDGTRLVWASYVGVGHLCRDMAVDKNGDVYVHLSYPAGGKKTLWGWLTNIFRSTPTKGGNLPAEWFATAFQDRPQGEGDCCIIKVKSDGSRVDWATYLGGSGRDGETASVRVDDDKYVYVAFNTFSDNMPTTLKAYDRSYNGGADFYIAKLTPDGTGLVYGTYLGALSDEWMNTHNLAIDAQGNAYVSIPAHPDFPTTEGAYQRVNAGGIDLAIAKISPTGSLIASTFIGGNKWENPDGIYVDGSGNVFLAGETRSTNFPVTIDAYQSMSNGGADAVLLVVSADFSRLLYSTLIGGSNDDSGRTGFLDEKGSLYLGGTSNGNGWPALNAYRAGYAGGGSDGIVAKFELKLPR